ncbi:CHAP domain-containing protein [Amycolatopsis sp. FDAARGOS 1241]|uniref:CHAP domain-containing protein n=1 Tax=Amycolatopsis sp. FDAARGOS 1241 TaxID=2778070 RepID=UPI00351CA364
MGRQRPQTRLPRRLHATPGAIAQTDAGRYGHVAVVDSVHGSTATVEDYNWTGDGHYLVHDIATRDFRYIHFTG